MTFNSQPKTTYSYEPSSPQIQATDIHMTVNTAQRFEGINLLKLTGHVMHHQFNIQQLYALPTQYLCVFYLFENKQRLVPLTA